MSDWLKAEAHADRALEMYERGRWAEAESELRKALALNPENAEWHFNLGLTLEASGRDVEALASYERAIELMSDQNDPLIAAGIVSNRLGRHERAIELFEQILKRDKNCQPVYAHLMEGYLRLGRHDEVETTYYLSQHMFTEPDAHVLAVMGESLLARSQHRRAGWCLKEALRLEPTLPRVRSRLASVYAALGKTQKAMQLYLRDLREDPGCIDTLLDYAELLIDSGRLPEAGEKLRRVLELEPANVDAHYRLAEIALRSGRFEKAQLEYELVLKLDASYPHARLGLAEAMLGRGRPAEARRTLREDLESPEGTGRADAACDDLARLGSLLLQAGSPAEAAIVLQRSLDAGADDLDLLRKLALARYQSGDRRGGSAVSRRVLRLEPHCVRSIHNLALAALDEQRLRVAAGWIRRGLQIDRHDDGLRRMRMRLLSRTFDLGLRHGWSICLSYCGRVWPIVRRRVRRRIDSARQQWARARGI